MSAKGTSPAERETFEVFSMSIALVAAQIILNLFGADGMTLWLTTYILAILIGGMLVIDLGGVRLSRNEKISPTPYEYLTRSAVAFTILVLSFLGWFVAGMWVGLDQTVSAVHDPKHAMKELSGMNFFMKLLFLEISHMTLYAFGKIWVNRFHATVGYFTKK